MGVPIGVKDIIALQGLPTTNGSKMKSEHLTGPEGTIMHRLKAAGCIPIGKTRTVEFALGATGVNEARGTPWNPWDANTKRIPGGSSSGSAVATAASSSSSLTTTEPGDVTPPPGAFLQATASGETAIQVAVSQAARNAKRRLDLFAGIGTLSLPLAADYIHQLFSPLLFVVFYLSPICDYFKRT